MFPAAGYGGKCDRDLLLVAQQIKDTILSCFESRGWAFIEHFTLTSSGAHMAGLLNMQLDKTVLLAKVCRWGTSDPLELMRGIQAHLSPYHCLHSHHWTRKCANYMLQGLLFGPQESIFSQTVWKPPVHVVTISQSRSKSAVSRWTKSFFPESDMSSYRRDLSLV